MNSDGNKIILLVEDEVIVAMVEAKMLQRYGYRVVTAHSGEQAVETAAASPEIDLALMDIDLGKGMDGTQAAEIILKQREFPLIFLSSHTEREVVEKTEGITSYGYIVKNSNESVLIASIKMAFRLFEARMQEREKDKALRESEERFRLSMEATRDGLWDRNVVSSETYYSPAYWDMLGYVPGEISSSGQEWWELLHPADRDAALFANSECIENRRDTFVIEFRMRSKAGGWRWIQSQGKAVSRDASGRALRVVGTHTDITERKRAEEALEKRLVALTRPLEDETAQGISVAFEDLFNLKDIQRLQDEFASATGVASIITHTDGTPITRPSNFCRLCSDIIRETDKGRFNCYNSDAVLGRFNPGGPIVQPCMSGGLWDAGAAISVGGLHIANWLIGQVRDQRQTEENMRAYAREIEADEEAVVQAFLEVPAMSREQFGRVSQALFTLANQLSTSAYQNVQQARFITERKRAEEALQKAFQEKRALFRELQHRTKNSFALITSMIGLTADASQGDEAKSALSEMGLRVRAMAELYDLLYATDAVSEVQLDEYCARVAASFHSYGSTLPPSAGEDCAGNIRFRQASEAMLAPVEIATP